MCGRLTLTHFEGRLTAPTSQGRLIMCLEHSKHSSLTLLLSYTLVKPFLNQICLESCCPFLSHSKMTEPPCVLSTYVSICTVCPSKHFKPIYIMG